MVKMRLTFKEQDEDEIPVLGSRKIPVHRLHSESRPRILGFRVV